MNSTDRHAPQTASDPGSGDPEALSLGELIAITWEGRFVLLGAVLLALLLSGYYAWRKSPTYQVNALVQIEDKKAGKGGPGIAAIQEFFDQPTVAQAEIEILKSNLVLGRAVEALGLDVRATPDFNILVGDARVRGRSDAPELLVERLEVPNYLKGKLFPVTLEGEGQLRWEGPEGEPLARGRVGEDIQATFQGQPILLKVRRTTGRPGQRFNLSRVHMISAISSLRENLGIAEKGKQTNILGLSFEHRNPVAAAEILNEILNQYVKQNIERKAEEASKTLAFLQEQMPQLRGKLDVAEERFNEYRMRSGSVDLPEEAKLLLKQSVELDGQVLLLKQKKQELLRTYKEGADVVTNLDQQIAKLTSETGQLEGRVRVLPRTQQEVVRLMRDVQVNTDLYTALLNNAQQLQVAKAGEIGNARIVDHAMPTLAPIKPKKALVMAAGLMLGIAAGAALLMVRRTLHRGVEDPRQIESRLGLPVVVTIPHSEQQEEITQKMKRREPGLQLLAREHPEDLAVESLRSLRTSLHFTMMDTQNPVVMITGPAPGIGKSFVSTNFAAILANVGAKILLVDGDLRKGTLHLPFGERHRGLGLSEVLAGHADWRKVLHESEEPGLDFITTGTLPPNPSELLMSSRFPEFIRQVSEVYDLVLIDAPPVLAVTDPVILAKHVGTVLMLVKANTHPLDEIRAAVQRFEHGGIKVSGCIFNDVPIANVGYRYYRYAYHYGYRK